MTQTTQEARPVSDVSTGSWQVTPLYSKINEKNPDDSSYVTSAPAPTSDSFTVALGPLQCPQQGTGKLTVRLRQTGTPALSALIELLQSGTVVASKYIGNPSTSFQDVQLNLPEDQVRPITDYSDLQVRVTAVGTVQTTCCTEAIPAVLHATITGDGDCSCVNGANIALTYNSETNDWRGAGPFGECDKQIAVRFYCQDGYWTVELSGCAPTSIYAPIGSCDPFQFELAPIAATYGDCCSGGDDGYFIVTIRS